MPPVAGRTCDRLGVHDRAAVCRLQLERAARGLGVRRDAGLSRHIVDCRLQLRRVNWLALLAASVRPVAPNTLTPLMAN